MFAVGVKRVVFKCNIDNAGHISYTLVKLKSTVVFMDKVLNIYVDTSSKEFMFRLGEIFASGNKIAIANHGEMEDRINKEQTLGYSKSFNMMIDYWERNSLSLNLDCFSAKNKNIFLICPVRNATEQEKTELQNLIQCYEDQNFHVHYPQRDTNQNPVVDGINTGGYNICAENAKAIAEAQKVVAFYNKASVGSVFDLGVTYTLMKQNPMREFVVANDFEYNPNDVIDNKIIEMIRMNDERSEDCEMLNH